MTILEALGILHYKFLKFAVKGNAMKELLSYAGTMAVVVVLAILFSLVLYSCIESPLQPVAPSYETQLSLQVLNKAWFFGDFHQKDTTRIPLNTDMYAFLSYNAICKTCANRLYRSKAYCE